MKTLFNLFFLMLLCSSCFESSEQDCLACDLQGNWIGEKDEEVMIFYQDKIVEDQPWLVKYFEPYRIENNEIVMDSIRFRKNEGFKIYKLNWRYKVEFIDDDSLFLTKYWNNNTSDKEELRLKRLRPLDQYEFKKISISSSPCLGSCPVFQLEVNSEGDTKYEAGSYTKTEGNFTGRLGKDELELIQKQIDQIEWENLKAEYWKGISDTQYFIIEMEDRNGERYKLTTNSSKLKAINILIFHAFRIVENSKLEETEDELVFSTDLKNRSGE